LASTVSLNINEIPSSKAKNSAHFYSTQSVTLITNPLFKLTHHPGLKSQFNDWDPQPISNAQETFFSKEPTTNILRVRTMSTQWSRMTAVVEFIISDLAGANTNY
jgi:hypothetical protein